MTVEKDQFDLFLGRIILRPSMLLDTDRWGSCKTHFGPNHVQVDLEDISKIKIDYDLIQKIFKSNQIEIKNEKIDRRLCGYEYDRHNDDEEPIYSSTYKLELLIHNPCSYEESLKELALIRWETQREDARLRAAEHAERQRRFVQQRREREVAEIRRKQQEILEFRQNEILKSKDALEEVFDSLWRIFEPISWMDRKSFAAKICQALPKDLQYWLFKFYALLNQSDCKTRDDVFEKFFEFCKKEPHRAANSLCPNGEPRELNVIALRPEHDKVRRAKERELEAQGYVVL